MHFQSLYTERDVEKLKKKLMKDKLFLTRILSIRNKIQYARKGDELRSFVPAHFMPTNAELLELYREEVNLGKEKKNQNAELLLRKIKTKSNSGVAVVSLLTKPFPCPGRCTYCPTEENMPKSYLAKEPAAARALTNNFNPRRQIFSRLESLVTNGHPIDKIEMIVIGGTWSFYHPFYQEWFISECFRAVNDFQKDDFFIGGSYLSRPAKFQNVPKGKSLRELQKKNETAECRIIGLSVETRPDYVTKYELKRMRELGVTKVEIGAQHLDDDVLKLIQRDMKSKQIAEAMEQLRNAGFKVVLHMMPNLPGSDTEKDIHMFHKLFEKDSPYQPDMLKIYPCMVLEKSELFETWKRGEYNSYTDEELMHVLREAKQKIPPYVRIIRVIRDIPATYIRSGSKISNMRQWLIEDQKKYNWKCRCIRCREVRDREIDPLDFVLVRREYMTPTGKEIFLAFERESDDILAAFLRLRLPEERKNTLFPELKNAALVRELHTYGRLTPLSHSGDQSQHVGFGRRLMEEAERIAKSEKYERMAVISGIGVREYYQKLGYTLEGTFMVKKFEDR